MSDRHSFPPSPPAKSPRARERLRAHLAANFANFQLEQPIST